MLKRTEGAAPAPFVYHRTIVWGDTDPARIVFTGRFLDYAVDAVEAWFTDLFGVNWYALNLDMGLGTPFRFANLDFKAPLSPRDHLEIEVSVVHVGTTMLRFSLAAFGVSKAQGRRLCFTGDLACVFVNAQTLKKTPIPDDFRAKLAAAGWVGAA